MNLPARPVPGPSNVVPIRAAGATDAELVEAARGGAPWATRQIYERHSRWVYGLAYRLTSDMEVDDLVQDTFVSAFESLGALKEPQNLRAWLRGIVIRMAARRIRWIRLRRKLGLLPAQDFEVESVLSSTAPPDVVAELKVVYRAVESMPAQQRTALILKRVEGMSHEQIADALGVSVPTARRRLSDAEAALARFSKEGVQ